MLFVTRLGLRWCCWPTPSAAARARRLGPLALMGLLLGLGVSAWSWIQHAQPATSLFGGMVVVDRFALFLDMIFLLAGDR